MRTNRHMCRCGILVMFVSLMGGECKRLGLDKNIQGYNSGLAKDNLDQNERLYGDDSTSYVPDKNTDVENDDTRSHRGDVYPVDELRDLMIETDQNGIRKHAENDITRLNKIALEIDQTRTNNENAKTNSERNNGIDKDQRTNYTDNNNDQHTNYADNYKDQSTQYIDNNEVQSRLLKDLRTSWRKAFMLGVGLAITSHKTTKRSDAGAHIQNAHIQNCRNCLSNCVSLSHNPWCFLHCRVSVCKM